MRSGVAPLRLENGFELETESMLTRTRWAWVVGAALVVLSLSAPGAAVAGPGRFRGIVTANSPAGHALRAQLRGRRMLARQLAGSSQNLQYWGGPVMHSDANYAIYWAPVGFTYPSDYATLINAFFTDVAAGERNG